MNTPKISESVNQRGVALAAALMILVVISLFGIVALRSSAFSNKVAMGAQLDSIVFEGAESVIAVTLANMAVFNDSDDEAIFQQVLALFNGEQIDWCLLKNGSRAVRSCNNADYMDSRNLVRAESRTASTGHRPVPGHQISYTAGGAVMFADIQVSIQADAELVGFNGLKNRHVQQALRRGMIPAHEIQ